jgi:glycosyltransferase involved in cell wall biosynthesis
MLDGDQNFCFVSPSVAMLDEIESYVNLSRWRKEVIPNPNVFVVKPRSLSRVEKPRLLYVGRLDPPKGLDVMLRAAERARSSVEFELDILGTGSLEPLLRQRYAQKDWVRFHGSVNQKTVAEFMSHATVLLVPSLWLENAPVGVVHALFANLPVLGSRIGGIPEHVLDGRTGRLLAPGDENAWAAEIARIIKDQDQVAAWSAACAQAAKRFDPQLALDKYEDLIRVMATDTRNLHSRSWKWTIHENAHQSLGTEIIWKVQHYPSFLLIDLFVPMIVNPMIDILDEGTFEPKIPVSIMSVIILVPSVKAFVVENL